MMILMDHMIILLAAAALSYPLVRRPLSEDDGNWFYPAFFQDRGVRLYRDITSVYGYFGIFSMAAFLFRIFRGRTPSFFKYFKAVWYGFNALAVYWLTLLWTTDHGMALIASLLLILVMSVPNTLFFLTYAEHFMILPFSLSLICMSLGLSEGGHGWFLASGLLAGWAVQIKPTALIFAGALTLLCIGLISPWTDISVYLVGLLVLNILPCFLLRHDSEACTGYLLNTFGGAFGLITILVDRISVRLARRLIPASFRSGRAFTYLQGHHHLTFREQGEAFRRFMGPSLRDLRIIPILASVQVIGIFLGRFDMLPLGMIILAFLCLLMQQIQKNYYTPHFNTVWMPLCILAAKTLGEVGSALFDSGIGWLALVLLLLEVIPPAKATVGSFQKQARECVGYLGPMLGTLFRMTETVGNFIKEHSQSGEKLLVWGDQPSIYLYANREAFHPDYLFLYTHMQRIHDAKECARFLDLFRSVPPEWLLFYQYKYADGWNMERLEAEAGIPYRFVTRFQIKDSNGKVIRTDGGFNMDFPLYKRDDDRYRDILLERSAFALFSSDRDGYLRDLKKIIHFRPEDEEVGIRLAAANEQEATLAGLRRYLESYLYRVGKPSQSSLAIRMLADLDRQEGRLEQAILNYGEAIKALPHDFRIFNGMADISFSRGDMKTAVKCVEQAYQLNPYSAETLNNLGVLHALKGEREKASLFFQKALKAIPGYKDAVANLTQLDETLCR